MGHVDRIYRPLSSGDYERESKNSLYFGFILLALRDSFPDCDPGSSVDARLGTGGMDKVHLVDCRHHGPPLSQLSSVCPLHANRVDVERKTATA